MNTVIPIRSRTVVFRHFALTAVFTSFSVLSPLIPAHAAPELDTQISHLDSGSTPVLRYNNTLNSTTAASLSDATPTPLSPWSKASANVSYGSATITTNVSFEALKLDQSNTAYASSSGNAQWTDTFTINPTDSSLLGKTGTMQLTYHLTGSMTVDGNFVGTDRENRGGFFVDGNPVRIGYDGTSPDQYDPNLGNYATYTYNKSFTFGTPFDLAGRLYLQAYATNENYYTGATYHSQVTFSSAGYTVLDGLGNAVSFAATAKSGSAAGQTVASGATYAGFTVTNTTPSTLGTTMKVLGGTATGNKSINGAFGANPTGTSLASDVVDFGGTLTDKFVLQLSYDPASAISLFGAENQAVLSWLSPVTNTWVNAVLGNSDGGAQQQHFTGAYNGAVDFVLGDYGVDTVNHTVWAVINHNSQFAVATSVPEPSVQAMLLCATSVLLGLRRRQSA